MSKTSPDPLTAIPERKLAVIAAQLIRQGRMPAPGRLADALAVGHAVRTSPALKRLARSGSPRPPYNRVFVSSSQRDGSTLNQARAGLSSPEFHDLILASHRMPGVGGGKNGLGFWADGAEESRIVDVDDPRLVPRVAAGLGRAFGQRSVLHFVSDPSGSDIAHVLTVPTDNAGQIASDLMRHGIEYKTVIPDHENRRSEVHVIDSGGDLAGQVRAYAQETGAGHEQHVGKATYLGAETREQAQKLFGDILRQ